MSRSREHKFGYARICTQLAERFGTNFEVEITGNCATLAANFEGGIQVIVTDCVGALSPVAWHLDGRAAGFFVGLHRAEPGTQGAGEIGFRFAYACGESTLPTAEAISDLVQEALEGALPTRFRGNR